MNKPILFHLQISVPQALVDSFINLLEDLSENVSWDIPDDPHINVNIDAFLSNSHNELPLTPDHIKKMFLEAVHNHSLPSPTTLFIKEIPEKNWLLENQLSFPPIEVGSFFIYGSHFKEKKPAGKISLEINAALAFGSGEHASTKGCLSALSNLKNFHPKSGLDVGCGSGVLAMAASLLFNIPIHAIDIDPFSIETTKENARQNNLQDKIICFQSNGYQKIKKQQAFDLILCNILAKPLCEMAPQLKHHLNQGGIAILSGLLNTQSQEVIEYHQKCGLQLINIISIGEWATLIFKNE